MQTPLLDTLSLPGGVKELTNAELERLAQELRGRIVDVCSRNGGHLAPSLGTVELTLALLATFDLDRDKLVWDVGHQTYAYKLLTGRAGRFDTLRQEGGLAGFPRLGESPYDFFGVGHASTSISAALGMAAARDLSGKKHNVIAVIGDGAMTGGMAFEGLNLAGHLGDKLIVVLNDNEMSIAPNVGAISRFLSRTLTRRWVRQTRKDLLSFLRTIPRVGGDLATFAERGEWSFKSFFTPGMLFEAFRFAYLGPVDGHDIPALRQFLAMAAAVEDGPVLVHIHTHKGKGFGPAEKDPTHYHGVGHFSPETGMFLPSPSKAPSFTSVFGKHLVKMGKAHPELVAITAAMPDGTGTTYFQEAFPDRFFDVGICEQHAVTFAAGLACDGYRPFVCIYSTFLQRTYDQIIHDVCLQQLRVTFCIDRAGLVGEDGATHQGVFDVAYLRHIPNIALMAPRDEDMLVRCMETAVTLDGPCAIRYPRGAAFGVEVGPDPRPLPVGEGEIVQEGERVAILALGSRVHVALDAADRVQHQLGFMPLVFDPVWAKPLPERQLGDIFARFDRVLTVEEACVQGGFGAAVLEWAADRDLLDGRKVRRLGVPDRFIEHAKQARQREEVGIDAASIARAVAALVGEPWTELEV